MDHKSYLTNNQNYFEFKTTIHFLHFNFKLVFKYYFCYLIFITISIFIIIKYLNFFIIKF